MGAGIVSFVSASCPLNVASGVPKLAGVSTQPHECVHG